MTKKKNLNILKPKELEGHKKKKKKKKHCYINNVISALQVTFTVKTASIIGLPAQDKS